MKVRHQMTEFKMLTKKTMITFYMACGWEPDVAVERAERYMHLQSVFHNAQQQLSDMTEQDEYRLQLNEAQK